MMPFPPGLRPGSARGLVLVGSLVLTTGGCDAFWDDQDAIPESTQLVSTDLTVSIHALLADGYEDYLVPNADVRVTALSWREKQGGPELFDEQVYEEKTDIRGQCVIPVRILAAHSMDIVEIDIQGYWEERGPPWYRGEHSLRFIARDAPSAWSVEMYLDTLEWSAAP